MAFNTWRRGMVVDPKNYTIRDSITRARLAVGKKLKEGGLYTQALVHFKELQKMMPKAWELHFEIADTLLQKFLTEPADGGVGQLYVVYTHFQNMVTQTPRVIRMLPLEVVEDTGEPHADEPIPLYDFEPSAAAVLDALLPQYVRSRIHSFLLQSAASELAARQRAMHTATENAEDLIRDFTRRANQARQSEITQEISEIVSGADALASS